jgi:hypothetical protein
MNRKDMRYIIKESKSGKTNRFHVWDNEEKRLVRGQLPKFSAIGLEGILNKKPHKERT